MGRLEPQEPAQDLPAVASDVIVCTNYQVPTDSSFRSVAEHTTTQKVFTNLLFLLSFYLLTTTILARRPVSACLASPTITGTDKFHV